MSHSVSAIVFDIGNVLIEWDPENLYRKLIPAASERDWFLTNICTMEWNLQQDLGRSWTEAVAVLSKQHPEYADLISAYSDRWHEMVPGPVPGTKDLLSRLHSEGLPLYALTNFSIEKFNETRARFDFLNACFRDIVVSGDERLIKPDPRIFQVLTGRNALDPAECLFIDDSLANVEAARGTGMAGHHFQNAATLERDLIDLGFLKT